MPCASYAAAEREVMLSIEHRKHKELNEGAENLHRPILRCGQQMERFKSAGQARRLLSAHDGISNLFHLRHHQVPAFEYRAARTEAFAVWAEITGAAMAS